MKSMPVDLESGNVKGRPVNLDRVTRLINEVKNGAEDRASVTNEQLKLMNAAITRFVETAEATSSDLGVMQGQFALLAKSLLSSRESANHSQQSCLDSLVLSHPRRNESVAATETVQKIMKKILKEEKKKKKKKEKKDVQSPTQPEEVIQLVSPQPVVVQIPEAAPAQPVEEPVTPALTSQPTIAPSVDTIENVGSESVTRRPNRHTSVLSPEQTGAKEREAPSFDDMDDVELDEQPLNRGREIETSGFESFQLFSAEGEDYEEKLKRVKQKGKLLKAEKKAKIWTWSKWVNKNKLLVLILAIFMFVGLVSALK